MGLNNCTTSCGCIPTVSLPTQNGGVGPAGPAGSGGGVVIYNQMSSTSVITNGSWQDLKTFNVPATQLATDGDELKISTCFELGEVSDSQNVVEVQVIYDGQYLMGTMTISTSQAKYGRFDITISRVADTNTTRNIFFSAVGYMYGDSTYGSPCYSEVLFHGPFYLTIDYGHTGGKDIKVQGKITGTVSGDYVSSSNLCVEYYKYTV